MVVAASSFYDNEEISRLEKIRSPEDTLEPLEDSGQDRFHDLNTKLAAALLPKFEVNI